METVTTFSVSNMSAKIILVIKQNKLSLTHGVMQQLLSQAKAGSPLLLKECEMNTAKQNDASSSLLRDEALRIYFGQGRINSPN